MCSPISLIMSEDQAFLPSNDSWNHSHTCIAKIHNLPDGMIGDKYARVEVTTPEYNVFRNKETNEKLVVNKKWKVYLDENRAPEWYSNDKPNQEDRAREAAKKWFENFPDNLVPGYRKIVGDCANITGGYNSILTGGNYSTLTGGEFSTLTGGDCANITGGNNSRLSGGYYSRLTGGDNSNLIAVHNSKLTGGDYSILTGGNASILTGGYYSKLTSGNHSSLTGGNGSTLIGGNDSILTGGNRSVFCAGENSSFTSKYRDDKRIRTITFYVGENNIEPNKKYQIIDDKIYDYETNTKVK